jgi:hypothetical protein
MEEADFERLKKRVEKVIHTCHLAALRGIVPHETLRSIVAPLQIKYAEKGEVRVEHNLEKFHADIDQHFVEAAEKEEYKILKDVLKIINRIYRAIFTTLVFEKVEILNMEHFVEKVVKSSKVPSVLKKSISKALLPVVKVWYDTLKELQTNVNAVWAEAKGRRTVAMAMTKMMQTHGASFFRRRQEINKIKEGHKDAAKAAQIENHILKMHFKSKDEADKEIEKLKELSEESFRDYGRATKLLAIDWEATEKNLQDLIGTVEIAVEHHELPEMDEKQTHELFYLIIEKITEPFIHSIRESVNQLAAIRSDLEGEAKKLEKS